MQIATRLNKNLYGRYHDLSNTVARKPFSTNGLVFYHPAFALTSASHKSADIYKHTCTVNGAVWQSDGRLYDGVDDYISTTTHAAHELTTAMTLLSWVKLDSAGAGAHQTAICKYNAVAGVQKGYIMWVKHTDVLSCRVGETTNNTDHAGTTNIQDDTWHLWGLTYDGAFLRLKLDGATEGTDLAYTNDMTASGHPLTIGCRQETPSVYDTDMKGVIGESWVYNRALTAGENSRHYNLTRWRY